MSRHRSTAIATVLAVAGLAAPAGAQAAGNPYTAQQVCGPSYALAQSIPLRSNDGKVQMGQISLMYSLETGKSCGVVMKTRQIGRATYTSVTVGKKPKKPTKPVNWKEDAGDFRYYAGPVYASGTPACVRVGGYMHVPHGREGIYVEPGWEGCS